MTKKQFNVFDVDGTIFLEDHQEGSYHIGEIGNVDVNCLNDIADRLNELNDENQKLKEEIIEWKSKYFEAMDTVINEYSTNIKEDMEELEKEVWGDDDD